ncbi:protein piccolo-like [Delphinapterus leucas]|uniref:Protein piccolo-like n=1 Tax=Delphinapterus leucas TaxID=9749 RepID=A0A7F8K9N3_DELLE|nr:protein piccolo-like [Delphinapterus leucas]
MEHEKADGDTVRDHGQRAQSELGAGNIITWVGRILELGEMPPGERWSNAKAKPTNHWPAENSLSTGSSGSSFGSGYSVDSEGSSSTAGDTNLFPIPRIGKVGQNGQEPIKQPGVGIGLADTEVKTQVMGEIKIALKKEMKTDGEQLIVGILQCRHITYKFKSPDHLPDLYVKIYVMNISTQEKVDQEKNKSM